jgi:hypothetical protein
MTLSFPYLKSTIRSINTPLRTTLPDTVYPTHYARENAEMELDLSSALQYGGSMGPIQVRTFLKHHLLRNGGVAHDDWDLILTNGNTDGLDNTVRMLCDRGSAILVEEFCYPATLAMMRPQGVLPVGLAMDAEGVVPAEMDRVLQTWNNAERDGHTRPRAMVIVPTGQNPTGATMSEQRRRDIYAVARKHNIVRPLKAAADTLPTADIRRPSFLTPPLDHHLRRPLPGAATDVRRRGPCQPADVVPRARHRQAGDRALLLLEVLLARLPTRLARRALGPHHTALTPERGHHPVGLGLLARGHDGLSRRNARRPAGLR